MIFDSGTIPWEQPVELFEALPDLRTRSVAVSLREAVELVRDTPDDRRWSLGVGLQAMPTFHMVGGRPVAVGFLNASTLIQMVEMLPAAQEG